MDVTTDPVESVVDEVLSLLADAEDEAYIGEAVSQLQHGLQCAQLATDAGADEHCILAALLHDVGHLDAGPEVPRMGDVGVADHEGRGADYLRTRGFSQKTVSLVANHVAAKRYLTFRHAAYRAKLSPASIETLRHQGGPMGEAEAERFEAKAHFKDILRVRAWDEQGKRVGWQVTPLADYAPMLRRHLEAHRAR